MTKKEQTAKREQYWANRFPGYPVRRPPRPSGTLDRQTILESDRDPTDIILRRTSELLDYVEKMPGSPDLTNQAERLQYLINQSKTIKIEDQDARIWLFERASEVRRETARTLPLYFTVPECFS
ncbi:MAG: hypothetical protein HN975_02160 [Anaerolineae bacterium]|jgi:hypothetical protein|nr:hypothetical protein [Anaerolineae bacterium]